MANFAKVLDGNVIDIMVADQDFMDTFIDTSPGTWVEAFPDAAGDPEKRYNFCGVGDSYNRVADAFYTKSPYPSWTLDTTTYTWEAPIERPSEPSRWNEEDGQWIAV